MFDFINTLITSIKDFFEGLFFSSSPEYQKKRQLKGYAAELKKLNPPLYHTGKILLPAFGSLLYQLYHFLQPVKAILDKTVNSPDIRAAEKYQALFFEAIFSEEQVKQHRSFSFQARSLILSKCKNYQETEHKLQEQIHSFKNFIRLFQTPAFKTREQELIKLFFLSDLCDFDYASFLSQFNNNLQLNTAAPVSISQDNFEEVYAGDVVKNLLDFQFIVRHVSITQTTINNIIFLARSLGNFTDETGVKLEKTLNMFETLLASQLKPLEGYNDVVNDAIQNLSPISFDWVKPMQLLKAFTEMYFEMHYKTFLKSLLIEGFFANKQIEGQYAAIYRSCEVLLGKITNFEQLFKPKGQCNLLEIQGYIAEIEKGKDMKKQLQKIVDIANMQAKTIVQTGSKAYADLYAFTEHLLEDIKAPTPELVTNIKALVVSSKNKESFTRLEQDRHIFAMFLEIMKNYAVFGSIEKGKSAAPISTAVPSAVPAEKPVQK